MELAACWGGWRSIEYRLHSHNSTSRTVARGVTDTVQSWMPAVREFTRTYGDGTGSSSLSALPQQDESRLELLGLVGRRNEEKGVVAGRGTAGVPALCSRVDLISPNGRPRLRSLRSPRHEYPIYRNAGFAPSLFSTLRTLLFSYPFNFLPLTQGTCPEVFPLYVDVIWHS